MIAIREGDIVSLDWIFNWGIVLVLLWIVRVSTGFTRNKEDD